MNKTKNFIKSLSEPDEEFSPVPFWFINDKVETDKITRDLRDFKEKGVDAVVLHPRIGIPQNVRYLSEEFFNYVEIILKTAKENDVKIVLYDEGMYPSGSAGGLVVDGHQEFRSRGLFLCNEAEGNVVCHLKDGKYLVNKPSDGRIRGIHYGEDDGEKNQPFSADILNGQAVDRFISITHENYYRRFAEYFGTVIIGFFTDEPNPLGRVRNCACKSWTDGLEKIIVERGGIIEELEDLFGGKENSTTKLYSSLINEIEREVYYKKLHDFCERVGISLIGHPSESDDIEKMKYFDIPAQDLVFRFVSREQGDIVGKNSVLGKGPADFARCAGIRRNANECLGCCSRDGNSWNLPPEDIKWFIDYLAVRGVNTFIPHAFYYSLKGKRKWERPPDVGPNTLYWRHYKAFSSYMKRLSYLMTDCDNMAKVAVLCCDGNMPYDEVKYFYENQIEFNYLPISYLASAKKEKDGFYIGKHYYRYLFNPYNLKSCVGGFERFTMSTAEDVKEREIYFKRRQKNLRVSHFVKNGVECFFIVNTGEKRIEDFMRLDCITVVRYDLWSGKFGYLSKNDKSEYGYRITIERNESVLLLVNAEIENANKYPVSTALEKPNFKFIKEIKRKYCKIYQTELSVEQINDDKGITVQAEEFVEWYVNGDLKKVTFWNPHKITFDEGFSVGRNVITIKVYGSVANKYGETELPYGLNNEE